MNRRALMKCILLLVWLASLTMSCGTLTGQGATPLETTPTATQQVQPGREPGSVDEKWFAAAMGDLPPDIQLVDVRSSRAFGNAHLPGSVNIPRMDFFSQDCEKVIPRLPRQGSIIFICTSGNFSRSVYFKLRDKCRYPEMDRVFFLDAEIDYAAGTLDIWEE